MAHRVQDVDIILTKSQFKGFGWLQDCGMTWEDYWAVFRKYHHALYVTNVSKEKPERLTELNYQFLTTVSIRAEEFRPRDLPNGWKRSPAEDTRQWLTEEAGSIIPGEHCAFGAVCRIKKLPRLRRRGSSRQILGTCTGNFLV